MAIGIFYGSNAGATQTVAELIKEELGGDIDLIDISDAQVEDFDKYSKIILGTSTWGEGDLQDDWDAFFEDFQTVDFTGKTVAFFGMGDQVGYEENFQDAMGTLYHQALAKGAKVVGDNYPIEGFDFDESTAVVDGAFVGLAVDDDNQDELTESRTKAWVSDIKQYFS